MSTPAVRNPNVIAMGLVANPSNDERQPWECPLTLERFVDPVTDECGHMFDRSSLISMVFKGNVVAECPLSRTIIRQDRLVRNTAMRQFCESIARQEARASAANALPVHPNGGSGPVAGVAPSSDPRIEEIMGMMKMQYVRSIESDARLNAKIDSLQRESDDLRGNVRDLRRELGHAVKKFDIQSTRMNNMLAMTVCDMASTVLPQWMGGVDLMTIANRNLTEKEIALITQPQPTLELPSKESLMKQHMDYKGAL